MTPRMLGTAALLVALASAAAWPQGAPPTPAQQAEKAVKTRQGLFDVIGFAFNPVGAMLKGAAVDAAVAAKAATRIEVNASMVSEVFQADTTKFQAPTKAKPNIWANKADFDKKANDLQTSASALEAAAKKGDRGAILDAAGKLGDACKACHEEYREK